MSARARFWLLVVAGALVATEAAEGKGNNAEFDNNFHLEEEETGGKLRLESKGKLSEIVDLDKIPSVKRVLCKGNKILVALKKDEPDVTWKQGQIIMGSSAWGCAMNTLKPGASSIYAKIDAVKRPKQYVVEVHTVLAGPLDMFEDASIRVHYEQGRMSPSRRRRYLSNPLHTALNNINWNASFSSNIPFNNNGTEAERFVNVYKRTGKFEPEADTEANTTYEGKDFLFRCTSCHGYSEMSYFFELKIYKVNNSAVVQKYNMQMTMNTHIQHNYSLYTNKEATLTKSEALWQTPSTAIFETPLAVFTALPPIKMAVNFSSQTNIFLTSMTKNETSYDGDFSVDGTTVISQSYEINKPVKNDVSSYGWHVTSGRQSVDTNSTANASYALHQNLTVVPLVFWEMKDIDMTMGPPIKISIRPRVNVVSTTDTVSRCDVTSVALDSNVSVAETDFKVDAFGIDIWNVKLMNSVSKKTQLLHKQLSKRCHADCHGPHVLNDDVSMETACGVPSGAIVRGDSRFHKLHQLWGDYILFKSEESNASWCGTTGRTCPKCTYSTSTSVLDDACADRIVNHDLAASVTRLAKLVNAEWPERKLVIEEAWDEPTSVYPSGRHGNLSVFYEGRGAEFAVTEPLHGKSSYTVENSPDVLERLGELAVCARFQYVTSDQSKTSACVNKVVDSGVKKRSLLSRKRRSGHVEHSMVRDILEEIDVELQLEKDTLIDPAPLANGGSHPPGVPMEQICGDFTGQISQDDVPRFKRLVEFPLNTVKFDPEGPADEWCGVETRVCKSCSSPSDDLDDTWSWCGTRTMNMRLAIRLQRLATLVDGKVRVTKALSMNDTDGSSELHREGRVARIRPDPANSMTMAAFTSKAILAGFDYVRFSTPDYIEVCVKPQDGIQAHLVQFPSANLVAVPLPLGEEEEYDYPSELVHEFRKPLFFDKSTSSNVISDHFRLHHFQSPGKRYIRLDPVVVTLMEYAYDGFPGGFHVIPGSGYRPRSVNMDNIDTRHPNEKLRFQMGQAVEIKPNSASTEEKLFDLAVALIRAGKAVRAQRIGMGFGCKADRLYFEVRPMLEDDSEPIEAWSSGNDRLYQRLQELVTTVTKGGTVVAASPDPVICKPPKLGSDHFYFNFDLEESGYCWQSHDDFCSKTHEHRYNISVVLQRRLTSAAGTGRLPRPDIMPEITECVIDACGGCPDAGDIWKRKVIACTKMVLKYLSRASVPFQPLKDKVSVFNTDNHESGVHSQACHDNKVCVENTNIYALLMPLITAKYHEDNVDELLFGGADNPSPLLEIVEQELSWRAEGKVDVFIENATDINTLRNSIKILLMYNKKLTEVVFHLDPDADEEDVGITLQRKVEEWSGSVCPTWSRIVSTPYSFQNIAHERKRRSLERSRDRNKMAFDMKNWEVDWMLKS